MTTSEIESWYKALFEEDCLQVKELLRKNPEFLKVGWKRDDSRKVKGSLDNHWKPVKESSWKGRTALHVGARRGDLELVQQVLILCDIPDATVLASGSAADFDSKHQIHLHIGCDLCRILPISGPRFRSRIEDDYDLCLKCFETSGAEENEYAKLYRLAGRTRRKPDERWNSTPDSAQKNSSTAASADLEYRPAAENSSANLSPQVLHKSARVDEERPRTTAPSDSGEEVATLVGKSAQGKSDGGERSKGKDISGSHDESDDQETTGESDLALQKYKASIAYLSPWASKINREAGESLLDSLVSISELRELFLSKDGEFELDALAMATLQGNVDIIVLLVYALGECQYPPYDIEKCESFSLPALIGNDRRHRIELTKVTKKIIDYFRSAEPDFMAACEEEYRRHRHFNFLPLEEYLFHFLWTSRVEEVFHKLHINKLRERIWKKVRLWPEEEETEEEGTDGEENPDEQKKADGQEKADKQKKPDGQEKAYEQKNPDEHEKANEQQNPPELWRFLLKLHDGQGRAPMHVSVDGGTQGPFIEVIGEMRVLWHTDRVGETDYIWVSNGTVTLARDNEAIACAMTALDGSGKLPLHRTTAFTGKNSHDYGFWKEVCKVEGVSAALCRKSEHPIRKALEERSVSFSLGDLSAANGFRWSFYGSTALQTAIIHNNFDIGRAVFESSRQEAWNMLYLFRSAKGHRHALDIMELVCLVGGDTDWVRLLLKDKYLEKSMVHKPSIIQLKGNHVNTHPWEKHRWPPLHLAAAYGSYDSLRLLIDNPYCEPFGEDDRGNVALHCVMRDGVAVDGDENLEFMPHLLDYASCRHVLLKDQRKVKIFDENLLADREGCINALLQAGCDIFKINKDKKLPYPQGRLSSSAKFLSWWYEKQSKEFEAIQNSLNNAANAITVTATLVATASFVGPLQPPRSYTDDRQIEYENSWVATFLFCDTLSFYLAIVAIVLSLIPSLPVPQQAMFDELRRTRTMVTLAVGVLFPSIVGILMAFASSSIAVVSPLIISERGRNLAVSSVSIGGLFIVGAFFIFLVRLLGICFPSNSWIRFLYKLTSF